MSESLRECAFGVLYRKFKPHILMLLVQIALTFLYFLVEASFDNGMNPHVFVTYRHALAAILVFPFAYLLERNVRPKLRMVMLVKLFLISLLGVGLTLNMYFASLKYTSPSFVTSMVNTISSLTFIIAVALRVEAVDVKNPRGLAKVFGSLLSLGGALTMTLYKGHAIQSLKGAPIHIMRGHSVDSQWIKGSILTVVSCITWSFWYIAQAIVVKEYPAQLSLTAWVNFMGAAQSAVFTAVVQHKPRTWCIKSSLELCCILYAAVICCCLVIFIQLWTVEQKGPVFVSMFNPLGTILVATFAYFIFGEQLHVGSVVGGVIVMVGLYLLLWGKESDANYKLRAQSFSTQTEEKESRTDQKVLNSPDQHVP